MSSPLFHVSGLHNAAIALLAQGATVVWNVGRFDPAVALEHDRAGALHGLVDRAHHGVAPGQPP